MATAARRFSFPKASLTAPTPIRSLPSKNLNPAMPSALKVLRLTTEPDAIVPGLVSVRNPEKGLRVDEQATVLQAQLLGDVDYVFFRRFTDGRSSLVAAYVIDNADYRFSEPALARIHHKLWLNGSAPLLYVGWPSRIDVLSCARGPDFWKNGAFT